MAALAAACTCVDTAPCAVLRAWTLVRRAWSAWLPARACVSSERCPARCSQAWTLVSHAFALAYRSDARMRRAPWECRCPRLLRRGGAPAPSALVRAAATTAARLAGQSHVCVGALARRAHAPRTLGVQRPSTAAAQRRASAVCAGPCGSYDGGSGSPSRGTGQVRPGACRRPGIWRRSGVRRVSGAAGCPVRSMHRRGFSCYLPFFCLVFCDTQLLLFIRLDIPTDSHGFPWIPISFVLSIVWHHGPLRSHPVSDK